MSATIDAVHLAAIANHKLLAQTAHPEPSLRLLVGHSRLLGSLVPKLVHLGVRGPDTRPHQPRQGQQSDQPAKSKFSEDFDECSAGGNFEWDLSDSSDDDSTSSSDWSDDGTQDDNRQHVDTKDVNAASQPTITGADDAMRELSLLDDHIAHLRFLASQTGADSSWLTAEFVRNHVSADDEPPMSMSIQAPTAVSSEKPVAEIISSDASLFHPSHLCLPPRNPARLAKLSALVPVLGVSTGSVP